MSRKKNILLASTCIVLGMALAGPAAHAAEEILTAVRSTHQFYLDGSRSSWRRTSSTAITM